MFEIHYYWNYVQYAILDLKKLKTKVQQLLKFIHFSKYLLVHGQHFDNETRVKASSDFGSGSFKWIYKILNVDKPNSKDNTCVFNMFEAKDYRCNSRFASTRFIDKIDLLHTIYGMEVWMFLNLAL